MSFGRTKKHHRLVLEKDRLKKQTSETPSSIDCYILQRSIDHNVEKGVKEFIKTHEKKLKIVVSITRVLAVQWNE